MSTLWRRVRRMSPVAVDRALAGVLLAGAWAELLAIGVGDGPVWLGLVFATGYSVPFAFRRRHPLLVTVIVGTSVVLMSATVQDATRFACPLYRGGTRFTRGLSSVSADDGHRTDVHRWRSTEIVGQANLRIFQLSRAGAPIRIPRGPLSFRRMRFGFPSLMERSTSSQSVTGCATWRIPRPASPRCGACSRPADEP